MMDRECSEGSASSSFPVYHLLKQVKLNLAKLIHCPGDETVLTESLLSNDNSLTPLDQKISMDDEFSAEKFIENFIWNIQQQKINLTIETWRKLLQYFSLFVEHSTDSLSMSLKVGLQILFLYSKCSVKELSEDEGSENKKTLSKYNENMLLLLGHVSTWTSTATGVVELNTEMYNKLKQFLLQPAIISSFQYCFKLVFPNEKEVDMNWLEEKIKDLKIYVGFLGNILRGATLMDGFVINSALFPALFNKQAAVLEVADLFTINCHECGHYLIRSLVRDYNFSTPFKDITGAQLSISDKRVDIILPEKLMEFGRLVELTLFDGVQMDWIGSSSYELAEKFIKNAEQYETCPPPLVSNADRINYPHFRERQSTSFGLDFGQKKVYLE